MKVTLNTTIVKAYKAYLKGHKKADRMNVVRILDTFYMDEPTKVEVMKALRSKYGE